MVIGSTTVIAISCCQQTLVFQFSYQMLFFPFLLQILVTKQTFLVQFGYFLLEKRAEPNKLTSCFYLQDSTSYLLNISHFYWRTMWRMFISTHTKCMLPSRNLTPTLFILIYVHFKWCYMVKICTILVSAKIIKCENLQLGSSLLMIGGMLRGQKKGLQTTLCCIFYKLEQRLFLLRKKLFLNCNSIN